MALHSYNRLTFFQYWGNPISTNIKLSHMSRTISTTISIFSSVIVLAILLTSQETYERV